MWGFGMLLTLSWVADCKFPIRGTCWDGANHTHAQTCLRCYLLVSLDGFNSSLERLPP